MPGQPTCSASDPVSETRATFVMGRAGVAEGVQLVHSDDVGAELPVRNCGLYPELGARAVVHERGGRPTTSSAPPARKPQSGVVQTANKLRAHFYELPDAGRALRFCPHDSRDTVPRVTRPDVRRARGQVHLRGHGPSH
eukprot:CAMPEP_0119157630 /NCGR_PEP_ID=MMETSP1310-20130426/52855_1 /TAXON_ID=464262 /ORGANISM="Genus nov. species nov., Strain RCC2339" /LENGTH=138 /DNA_ID=CAMNT_0007150249 /DNA_START=1324 /DNA_END=1741 /DNA_ORIENTATION=-